MKEAVRYTLDEHGMQPWNAFGSYVRAADYDAALAENRRLALEWGAEANRLIEEGAAMHRALRERLYAVRRIIERSRPEGVNPWQLLHEIDIATSHESSSDTNQ